MRARPEVKLFVHPGVPVAGRDLEVEAVLVVRARTPIDGATISLRGEERVQAPDGGVAQQQLIVGQHATFGGRVLEPGEHRLVATFHLPPDAPGAYQGERASISYEIEVHVRVPLWLDRRACFSLPVRPAPRPLPPPNARTFANHAEGPAPGQTYAELSLDDENTLEEGLVRGALSLVGAPPRTRRVVVSSVICESARFGDEVVELCVTRRFPQEVLDRPPRLGEPITFSLRLPSSAPVTTRGELVELSWAIEVTAEVPMGQDFVWSVPIRVFPREAADEARSRQLGAPPPVGNERLAQLWRLSAERLGLRPPRSDGLLIGEEASGRFWLRLDRHARGSIVAVAEVAWPRLRGGLELRERRSAAGPSEPPAAIDRGPFDARFRVVVRGPLAPSLGAIFGPELRSLLLSTGEACVDENGASLLAPIDLRSVDALVASLSPLLAAARSLCVAVEPFAEQGGSPYRLAQPPWPFLRVKAGVSQSKS